MKVLMKKDVCGFKCLAPKCKCQKLSKRDLSSHVNMIGNHQDEGWFSCVGLRCAEAAAFALWCAAKSLTIPPIETREKDREVQEVGGRSLNHAALFICAFYEF